MFQIVAWLAVGTMWCLLVTVDSQIPNIFFPFGPNEGDSPVDFYSGLRPSFDAIICGDSDTGIEVSWDGCVYLKYYRMISLFNTMHGWLSSSNVYARTTNDKALMAQVSELVAAQCSLAFEPQNLLIATWENVTYATHETGEGDESSPRNSYQLVLATDAHYTFAIFNYKLTWYQAPTFTELPMVSINCGTISYKLPWYGTSDIFKLGSESNVGTPGRWLYRVDSSTDFGCPDINECASSPCLNGGTCIDGANRYTCSCQAGYTGVNCQSDIDECSDNKGGCEQNCVNTPSSYYCTCDSGFKLNGDGIHCDDIDECATNKGGCEQNCVNTPGSYVCSCEPGFALNADGMHCDDINKCASNPCLHGGTCVDAVNGYSCRCPVLYTGTNCELVTACQITSEDQRHSCGVASRTEQECINAGCCWDGTHANMICFRKIIRKCAVAESNRIRCPGVFTTEGECKAATCCWDSKAKPGMINCYLPE